MVADVTLAAAVIALAFANGANDNMKAFASAYGSEALSYPTALALATVATAAGTLAAMWIAPLLVQPFRGAGLVSDAVVQLSWFRVSVAAAGCCVVLLSTLAGWPVSTTHALVGALLGAGTAAGGMADISKLWPVFVVPLLLSPLLALSLSYFVHFALPDFDRVPDCLCLIPAETDVVTSDGVLMRRPLLPDALLDSTTACEHADLKPTVSTASASALAHILSATATAFARSVNDAPKIAALLLAWQPTQTEILEVFLWIAVGMTAGGLVAARRVADTMGHDLTELQPAAGLAANFATATVVLLASLFGLPVSTTHVSVGAIVGTGVRTKLLYWQSIGTVLFAWLVTLPTAAALGYLLFLWRIPLHA